MFENITQLENEVKEFHKNILASQDLLKRLDALIQAINEEQRAVVSQSETVNQSVAEQTEHACTLLEETAAKIQQSNAEMQKDFESHADRLCQNAAERTEAAAAAVTNARDEVMSDNHMMLEKIQNGHDCLTENTDRTLRQITESNNKVISNISAGLSELNTSLLDAGTQNLEAIRTATKVQSASAAAAVTQAVETMTACNQSSLEQIQAKYQAVSEEANRVLKAVTDGNAAVNSEVSRSVSDLQTALTAAGNQQLESNGRKMQDTVEQINQICEKLLQDLTKQNQETMKKAAAGFYSKAEEYSAALQESKRILEQSQKELQQKYDEFVRAMSSDNLHRIIKNMERMEKSMNSKFTLLFAGLGLTALLALISIFF